MGNEVSKIDFKGNKMGEGEDVAVSLGDGGDKKKKLIILIAALLVVLLFLGAAWWWFFLRTTEEDEVIMNKAAPADVMQDVTQTTEGQLENPIFSETLQFTVNLKDGKRFLRVSMKAVLEDPLALEFLMFRVPLIKDAIITTLQNKTTVDLRDHNGILNLKRDIRRKLNNLFTEEFIKDSDSKDRTPVKKILFEEYLLQ